ncbi:uncharacterized protein LOC106653980 [Trichogramma pretiosum]|uniref:uncharacterized protein LOC106653980 n=1 Tax=Trichogramma pretiosum TaxID=7493 RepID=UPI0006C964E7|nr:uncharacterized protein LOC106653980 [Trichogramma pretiosum]
MSCKDVKAETQYFEAITTRNTEYQKFQAIAKEENKNRNNDINETIFINFECKNVKLELTSLLPTICKTETQSNLPIVKIENSIQTEDLNVNVQHGESKEVIIFNERTRNALSPKCN